MQVKKPKILVSLEKLYPTKEARVKADAAFDRLPLSTTMGEACRVWELEYLKAGGKVAKGAL